MPLYQLLYHFKQKQINQADIAKLLATMELEQLKEIPLWRISSLIKLTTSTAKLQGYLVIIAGLLFIPAAIYEKYQQDHNKVYRLAAYTPIAVGFVLAPMLLYKRNVRKILNGINFDVPTNSFKMQTYTDEILTVPLQNMKVHYSKQKSKIVHQIEIVNDDNSKRAFKIEGYGEWESSEVFKYIVENGGIRI